LMAAMLAVGMSIMLTCSCAAVCDCGGHQPKTVAASMPVSCCVSEHGPASVWTGAPCTHQVITRHLTATRTDIEPVAAVTATVVWVSAPDTVHSVRSSTYTVPPPRDEDALPDNRGPPCV